MPSPDHSTGFWRPCHIRCHGFAVIKTPTIIQNQARLKTGSPPSWLSCTLPLSICHRTPEHFEYLCQTLEWELQINSPLETQNMVSTRKRTTILQYKLCVQHSGTLALCRSLISTRNHTLKWLNKTILVQEVDVVADGATPRWWSDRLCQIRLDPFQAENQDGLDATSKCTADPKRMRNGSVGLAVPRC